MKKIYRFQLVGLLTLIAITFLAGTDTIDPRIDKIIQHFNYFNEKCSQQKIYIHTDKDTYLAGETMWLKSYIMDASMLLPDSVSKELYVELLDVNNIPVYNIIIHNNGGYSSGEIKLSDTLIAGNYQVRAYSKWMRNFDPGYFYHKTVNIVNPNYENIITKSRLNEIKHFNQNLRSLENEVLVTFFPEGGYLVAGLTSTIAFKAETKLGTPLQIEGDVYDNHDKAIVSFKTIHDGLGTFKFTPQQDVKYTVKIKNSKGKTDKFIFPKVMPVGISMSVDPFGATALKVSVTSNKPISPTANFNDIIIVAQSRGVIVFVSKGILANKPIISLIPKKVLPSGITQITLFDGQGEPICERLVFTCKPFDGKTNNISITSQTKNDSVSLHLKASQINGTLFKGNFSLSVIEALPGYTSKETENIQTNLLLTSDLKGRINNPAYYFDNNNPEALKHIDLVMLTNGWRRFVWKELLTNSFPIPPYSKSGGINVKGFVSRDFSGSPFVDNKIELSIAKPVNEKFITRTNSSGRFEFPKMDYEDTINMKVEASNTTENMQFIMGDSINRNIFEKPNYSFLNESYDNTKFKANKKKYELRMKNKPNSKVIDNNENYKLYNEPADVVKSGSDVGFYNNMFDYLQGKVAGVIVKGNQVRIRDAGTYSPKGGTSTGADPLFLIDGVSIEVSAISSINPRDIAKVDILKGPEAFIYGSRGAFGVIAMYSKNINFAKSTKPVTRGVLEYTTLGYHVSREFYVPPYETWQYKPEIYNVPKTVFWQPNIVLNDNGEATINFKKKFPAGKFSIILEGITNTGEIVHQNISE